MHSSNGLNHPPEHEFRSLCLVRCQHHLRKPRQRAVRSLNPLRQQAVRPATPHGQIFPVYHCDGFCVDARRQFASRNRSECALVKPKTCCKKGELRLCQSLRHGPTQHAQFSDVSLTAAHGRHHNQGLNIAPNRGQQRAQQGTEPHAHHHHLLHPRLLFQGLYRLTERGLPQRPKIVFWTGVISIAAPVQVKPQT